MVCVPSPMLLFYQLAGHPLSLWGVSFWYLWRTCLVVFFHDGELSSVCVQNKNTLTYCIYIYMLLLSSLGDSAGVFLFDIVIVWLLLLVESFRLILCNCWIFFLQNSFKPTRSNLKSDCLFVVLDLLDSVVWSLFGRISAFGKCSDLNYFSVSTGFC